MINQINHNCYSYANTVILIGSNILIRSPWCCPQDDAWVQHLPGIEKHTHFPRHDLSQKLLPDQK